ncbi:MAG TPA: hypothetical protein VFQ61_34635 [Polyangiaceae bacterium]|nr:hypothetical protein [Polyangiaceae bacterium]
MPDAFTCQAGDAVAWEDVCDGEPQCADAEDELLCFARRAALE